MSEPFEAYIENQASKAEEAEVKLVEAELSTRRAHERHLRELGRSPHPYAAMSLSDIETYKAHGRYALMLEDPDFAARVRYLEDEAARGLERVKAAGDRARASAAASPPPEVRRSAAHAEERARFLRQVGVSDAKNLPAAHKKTFAEIVRRQAAEITEEG